MYKELKKEPFNKEKQSKKAKIKLSILKKILKIWILQNSLEDYTELKDYLISINYEKTPKFTQINIKISKNLVGKNFDKNNEYAEEKIKLATFEEALKIIKKIDKKFKKNFFKSETSDVTSVRENNYNLKTFNPNGGNYEFNFNYLEEDKNKIFEVFDLKDFDLEDFSLHKYKK